MKFAPQTNAILNNPGWEQCDGCEGKTEKKCAIFNKFQLLKNTPHITENLSHIILLLQLNNEHFTIRELLNLATNTLLASIPKPKALRVTESELSASTLNCSVMSKIGYPEEFNSE
ncbi:hypothetical protein ACRTDY_03605 [Vibrio alginolyticus]|uniref:hypothetical protein n=1 Tax=Vibrio alginolyticus TaxID=663 RepID=UPI003D7E4DC0